MVTTTGSIDGGKKKAKRKLSAWQKFVKKHLGSDKIQKLPFAKRLKEVSKMWKESKENPANKK